MKTLFRLEIKAHLWQVIRGILRSPHTRRLPPWGSPHREKPKLTHLIVGLAVSASSFAVFWISFGQLLAELLAQVLSSGGIPVKIVLGLDLPVLTVRLLDGSSLDLVLTWQRSGLISITIFGLLFVFVMFPLDGSVWSKTAWLECGFLIGLIWSIIRLCIGVLVGYHYGLGAFAIAEFFMGPFTDFLWVVSVWSIGLSSLISAKQKRVS